MATMIPIANIKAFQVGMPIIQPIAKNERPISTARIAVKRLKCVISLRSGDTSSPAVWVRCAILPSSVCIPVAKTTALACPDTIEVPASTTFLLSIKLSTSEEPASRALGTDSPVTAALLTRAPNASISRQSAGMLSPCSRWDYQLAVERADQNARVLGNGRTGSGDYAPQYAQKVSRADARGMVTEGHTSSTDTVPRPG
jgi:hypothetical protein